jgi:solute carrier family 35 protein E1
MSKDLRIETLVGLFVAWYGMNATYNVYNSYVKSYMPFPFIMASSQLLIGLFYAIPLWMVGLRTAPKLSVDDIVTLTPITLLNVIGHVSSVYAMFQKGGGSFTHVIKASEPVVSVIVGYFMFGNVPKLFTLLSLLPITYGVAYASTLGNLSIATMKRELTSPAAIMAMTSNVSFALRSALRKRLPYDFKVIKFIRNL